MRSARTPVASGTSRAARSSTRTASGATWAASRTRIRRPRVASAAPRPDARPAGAGLRHAQAGHPRPTRQGGRAVAARARLRRGERRDRRQVRRDAPRRRAVRAGGLVLGICNGCQILCEAGLLPGALVRNRSLSFVCDVVTIRVETAATPFTHGCRPGDLLRVPIKHGEGCYVADEATLAELEARDQVVFRYVDQAGRVVPEANPTGSLGNVAGVCNAERNVLGLMPHPEHAAERVEGG